MKIFLLSSLICSKLLASLPLMTDFHKAKELAAIYEMPIALAFEMGYVIQAKNFEEACGTSFIWVAENSDEGRMVILLDKDGREFTRIGLQERSSGELAALLNERVIEYQKLCLAFEMNPNEEMLERLYVKASEIGAKHYKEKILEKGIGMQNSLFFLVEKYAALVNRGEKESLVAKEIRDAILVKDPKNEKGSRLRLALIDFQEAEGEPEKVVEPLEVYMKEFGQEDEVNLMKISHLISEYLTINHHH